MDYDLTECQIKNIDAICRNGGLEFPELFAVYTSGTIGPYFIQSIVIEQNGQDYKYAIDSIKQLIKDNIDYKFNIIAGGETRDWDFSNPVAYTLGKAHAKLYKNGKILGADMNNEIIVHVADLNNQGSSPRDSWVPMIENAGGYINDIFFFIDRMEEGVHILKDMGLKSHSVVQLDSPTWDYLLGTEQITSNTYDSLMERRKNKTKWAEDMLLSTEGLQKMNELLNSQDEAVRTKAIKILNNGYPRIKNEIIIGIDNL